jgi:DNA repair photolyase
MSKVKPLHKGRGTRDNPATRFEVLSYRIELDDFEHEVAPKTQLLCDPSRTILSKNNSPDVGFAMSVNPYRGCEHGCIYCYARPTHEWLGFSAGLDFETRILVKQDAPRLLGQALASSTWQPQTLTLSGVTDPYQPAERQLQLTRGCLEMLVAWRNPVVIVTKNALVARDCDLLAQLAAVEAVAVFLSVTTLDLRLARVMEPRTSAPSKRLEAISRLAERGVPVGVMVAPIIPGLTDHEIPMILNAAAAAGARFAGHTIVRLPYGIGALFTEWLGIHYPERKRKILQRIRAVRHGKLNDARWHTRMRGEGVFAETIHRLFVVSASKAGLATHLPMLSTAAFRRAQPDGQLSLF